jgi:hypothetical protein
MTATRERFEQGMIYEAYKAQMTRNRERFVANEKHFQFSPEDAAAFASLPNPLPVLVLAEDWCGDVVANLPVLGKVAAQTGKLDLRLFLRDQNLDLMDAYLKEGKYRSIPVFVFFDQDFHEMGRMIERPAAATARRDQFRAEFAAKHPEFGPADAPFERLTEDARAALMQGMMEQRQAWTEADEQDLVRAIRGIVEPAA